MFNPKSCRGGLRPFAKGTTIRGLRGRPKAAPTTNRQLIGREARTALCFLAPSLIGLSATLLLPTLDVIRRSFLNAMGNAAAGLSNYISVIENESFRLALKNTGRFLAVCIPLLLSLSLCVALMLYRLKWCKTLLKTSYLLPLAIPVTSVVLIIQAVFHRYGLLSALAVLFGGHGADWLNSEHAFTVLVICYLWKNLGYNVVLWLAGLSGIPDSYYEAASIDGAGALRKFTSITLPLLAPTAIMTAILALINSFKVFREAYLVAGSYPHESIYMLQHLLSNWFANLDMQKISAAAALLLAAVLLMIGLSRVLRRKGVAV